MKFSILAFITVISLCYFPSSIVYGDSLSVPSSSIHPSPPDSLTTQTATEQQQSEYPLSPERREKLNSYTKFTNIWRIVDFFSTLAILSLILFTGLSAKIRNFAKIARKKFLITWLYLAVILIVLYVIQFPLDYYRNFVVESQYGFMNQSSGGWLLDSLKSLIIIIIIGIIPMWFFYFLVERIKRWWLVFSIGAIPFLIFFMVIAPVVISPMFNKFEPLRDKQLETKILTLADKAGIEGSRVFEVDASKQSTKVNAYCTGMFGTTRIVLYDTIIKGFTHDEIMFVMGHEMGHYVMKHLWWGLGVGILYIFGILWLTDKTIHRFIHKFRKHMKFERLGDIASLPLVLIFLSVISLLFDPISNGISRFHERQSDKYAMDITGISGDAAATAFEKLSAYNLSDPNPNPVIEFWFYDHPALKKRIEFVRNYKH